MKPKSWKLFWLTISLSVAFVVILVGTLLIYAAGKRGANYKCQTFAKGGDSFHVELNIPNPSWRCVIIHSTGVSTEVRIPLY